MRFRTGSTTAGESRFPIKTPVRSNDDCAIGAEAPAAAPATVVGTASPTRLQHKCPHCAFCLHEWPHGTDARAAAVTPRRDAANDAGASCDVGSGAASTGVGSTAGECAADTRLSDVSAASTERVTKPSDPTGSIESLRDGPNVADTAGEYDAADSTCIDAGAGGDGDGDGGDGNDAIARSA